MSYINPKRRAELLMKERALNFVIKNLRIVRLDAQNHCWALHNWCEALNLHNQESRTNVADCLSRVEDYLLKRKLIEEIEL